MVVAFLLGSWEKWLWQSSEMRYGSWQLCLLYVPEGHSSPVRAKIAKGWCVSHGFFYYPSISCLDIEINSLRSSQSHKAEPPHPHPPLLCTVYPPSVWRKGIVVIIAFRTRLGSGPRIFQLWSLKPITYLLHEDTQSGGWKPCVALALALPHPVCAVI